MKKKSKVSKFHEKMVDYRRFAVTLICMSVFIYMGTLISISRGMMGTSFLMLLTILLLCGAAVFCSLSSAYQKKSTQDEEF